MDLPKRLLIVGGVAGGASAAARARRLNEEAEIILFERGEHISFANCGLPYHISGVIPERDDLLVQTAAGLRRRFRIDVRVLTEVTAIDRGNKKVSVRDLKTGAISLESYDKLILSPGAAPMRPPLPGVDSPRVFTLRSMQDMDKIKAAAQALRGSRAVVMGGGFIGLEMAETFAEMGLGVDLVEMLPQVLGPLDPEMAVWVHRQLRAHGIALHLGRRVLAFHERERDLEVELDSGERLGAGLVLMAAGVRPDIALAREAGLTVGARGGITVDAHQLTSDPDIYAVGDAVEAEDAVSGLPTYVPLAGPANRQGRIAADHIFGKTSAYRGTQGTAICKIFDWAAASTGMNEKQLKSAGRSYEKIYLHAAQHAGYYPGAKALHLKVIFEPQTGKLLGAQAAGPEGVDKRMDVLAVALRAGLTVYDLEHLELSYAPPFGSAKDPVNMAGFIASNLLRGDAPVFHASDILNLQPDQMLLDVRSPGEFARGTIPGAVNLPVDDLRVRIAELPKEKELLVFCQVGLRGYLATRILAQQGYRCRNLSGGYATYLTTTEA